MSGHTPGPWHVEVEAARSGRRLIADLVGGFPGLTEYRIVHDGDAEGSAEADARLIAAAPDLYEALRALCAPLRPADVGDEDSPWCQAWSAADAAIAMAVGK